MSTIALSPARLGSMLPPSAHMPGVRHLSSRVGDWGRASRCKYLIWSIVGVNTAVFAAWQVAYGRPPFEHIRLKERQPLLSTLQENFLLAPDDIQQKKYWTLVTSEFSHVRIGHFIFNMFAFQQLSKVLIHTPGVQPLSIAGLVLGSAVSASLGFVAFEKSREQSSSSNVGHVGLGASGVVMGVTGAVACIAPKLRVLLFGVVPMPMWAFGIFSALFDTYFLGKDTGIGHSAHLGGAAFGVAYYFLRLRKFRFG